MSDQLPAPSVYAENATQQVAEQIQTHLVRAEPAEAGLAAGRWFTTITRELETAAGGSAAGGTLACRAGCSLCCQRAIRTDIPTVLAIARHIGRHFHASALACLRGRLMHHIAIGHGLSDRQRNTLRLQCPLLLDNLCSIYEVRPLSCRGFSSYDFSICESELASGGYPMRVPAAWVGLSAQQIVERGMEWALAVASPTVGQDVGTVNLVPALVIALFGENVVGRWNHGADVFAEAR